MNLFYKKTKKYIRVDRVILLLLVVLIFPVHYVVVEPARSLRVESVRHDILYVYVHYIHVIIMLLAVGLDSITAAH